MSTNWSIAIETSCRRGGIALGKDDALVEVLDFSAAQRHATQLVARMDELLTRHGLKARQLSEIYISIGPGSFTGLRVGVTVARTLAQLVAHARCVAVPTIDAVALNAADSPPGAEHLAVVMDAKDGTLYLGLYRRQGQQILPAQPPRLIQLSELPAALPRPVTVIGEALGFQTIAGEGITPGPEELYMPRPGQIWTLGRRMAQAGQFTEYHQLQPLYLRKPEAIRLWVKQGKP